MSHEKFSLAAVSRYYASAGVADTWSARIVLGFFVGQLLMVVALAALETLAPVTCVFLSGSFLANLLQD